MSFCAFREREANENASLASKQKLVKRTVGSRLIFVRILNILSAAR